MLIEFWFIIIIIIGALIMFKLIQKCFCVNSRTPRRQRSPSAGQELNFESEVQATYDTGSQLAHAEYVRSVQREILPAYALKTENTAEETKEGVLPTSTETNQEVHVIAVAVC